MLFAPVAAFLRDARYAIRILATQRGFTVAASLTLAISIGLNTAVFSVVNAMLLRPLPIAASNEVVRIYRVVPENFLSHTYLGSSDFAYLRESSRSFSGLSANMYAPLVLEYRDASRLIMGELVAGNYFSFLGVTPVLGRAFTNEEDTPEAVRPVAVLSHLAWRSRFGSAPNVVGETLRINGHPFTIIGVAPKNFFGLTRGISPEVWLPLEAVRFLRSSRGENETVLTGSAYDDNSTQLWAFARLASGASLAEAQAEVGTLAKRLDQTFPNREEEREFVLLSSNRVRVLPGIDSALRTTSLAVLVFVALVLVIACTNVATMMLARAVARREEITLRLCLGATPMAIVRQLMTESLLLALVGGVLGMFVAFASNEALTAFRLPIPIDVALGASLDLRVFVFAVAVSAAAAAAFGLAPALETRRISPSGLNDTSVASPRAGRKRKLQSALVVVQLAVSLTLLSATVLSLRSMQRANLVDLGFESRGAVVATFAPRLQGYTPSEADTFYRELLRRVRVLPGITSAGFTSHLPLSFEWHTVRVAVEGEETVPQDEWYEIDEALVGAGYFKAMRTELIEGRTFVEQDTDDSPFVAVINENFADRLSPTGQALGKRFRVAGINELLEVVGVVKDGKYRTLGEAPRPFLYRALTQDKQRPSSGGLSIRTGTRTLVARTSSDPEAAVATMRRSVRDVDDEIAISGLKTLESAVRVAVLPARVAAAVFGLFGLLGLVLAAIGTSSIMAYTVSQRTREIGIRMALGARRRHVLTLLMRNAFGLIGVGVGLGLAGSILTRHALSSVLFGVGSGDAVASGGMALVFTALALVATYLPARRASAASPLAAIRYQ